MDNPETTDYGQPIETAPRDGSKIQVRSIQSGKWHTAKWDPEGDSWADEFGIACEAGLGTIQVTGYWSSEGGWFQPNEVDRWKPLSTDDNSQTTGWQPIETCPRMECSCCNDDHKWIGRHLFALKREWGWEMWVGQRDDGDIWLGRTDNGSCFDTDVPTHWMPLPDDPEDS